jgi:cell division protein FtsW
MNMRRRVGGASTGEKAVSRRHRPDYQIVLFMGILVLLGLVVLFAISPARVELINQGGGTLDQAHFMQKQLTYLVVGVVAFVGAATLPLKIWQTFTSKILLAGFAACLLLSFLGLFLDGGIIIETGGATRWYNFGIASFQPAELLKFGLLLFTAAFLARRMKQGKINDLSETLVPLAVLIGAAGLLIIVFQKDMGTGITLLGMIAAMLFIAGLSVRMLLLSIASLFAVTILLIITSPHRIARVLTFFNPTTETDTASYHINQAAIALGSGGFFGKGLGQSVQAFGYLPEAVNDSIFAILGETFGFVGLVVILVVFAALLHRILKTMESTIDPAWRLIVAGVFGLIATHLVVNVGAMTGVFPLTGVTLPFLSFGGTSLLFTMIGLGIVFNISRFTTHQQIVTEARDESSQRRRGIGGSRDSRGSRLKRA